MQITDAELEVMKVLWERGESTAADLHGALAPSRGWSKQTVKTLLSRLTDKNAVTATADGRRYIYAAHVSREVYEAGATRRFVDKVYSGRAAPLVAHLAEGEGLTDDDIADLEALIERLKS